MRKLRKYQSAVLGGSVKGFKFLFMLVLISILNYAAEGILLLRGENSDLARGSNLSKRISL